MNQSRKYGIPMAQIRYPTVQDHVTNVVCLIGLVGYHTLTTRYLCVAAAAGPTLFYLSMASNPFQGLQ